MAFTGFSKDALQFLVDLALNNERGWFQPRKAEYERLLKEPLEALIADLAVELGRKLLEPGHVYRYPGNFHVGQNADQGHLYIFEERA